MLAVRALYGLSVIAICAIAVLADTPQITLESGVITIPKCYDQESERNAAFTLGRDEGSIARITIEE